MQQRVQRLRVEAGVEETVAEDAEEENGDGERVAAEVWGAEETCQDVVRVFEAGERVPVQGVEGDGGGGD